MGIKITYHFNPLASVIHLDQNDKNKFKYTYLLQVLDDRMTAARVAIHQGDNARALEALTTVIEDSSITRVKSLLKSLKSWHNGYCTGHKHECLKCIAEEVLEINTIDGLTADHGYWLFNNMNEKKPTIIPYKELREWLNNYYEKNNVV